MDEEQVSSITQETYEQWLENTTSDKEYIQYPSSKIIPGKDGKTWRYQKKPKPYHIWLFEKTEIERSRIGDKKEVIK